MLPSSQRLSRQQVTDLLKNPQLKVIFNRTGTLKWDYSPTPALTVVTGSKQQKKAVLRNKLRRQLYNIFHSYQETSQKSLQLKGILYISKQLYDMSFLELKDNFYALLSKTTKNS
jgi:ribonuclease P protein component